MAPLDCIGNDLPLFKHRLKLAYGKLIAASLAPTTELELAIPAEQIDLTSDGVAVTTCAGTVRAGAAILTVSTAVLAGDAIRLPAGADPWREAAAVLPLGRNEKLFLQVCARAPSSRTAMPTATCTTRNRPPIPSAPTDGR